MSELQISLLAIGLLIVAGVYGFNRFQERKYRRIAEKAFPARQEDVLLDSGADTLPDAHEIAGFRKESRIEPVVSALPDEMPVEPAEEL
ncbi:MAG: hypothetical protein K8H75_12415, partial [Sulfuricella sp.]|nr:hypothetical protein [Sulfuricella sp.]